MDEKKRQKLGVFQRVFGKEYEYFDDEKYPWVEVPSKYPEFNKKYRYFEKRIGGETWYRRIER